MAITLGQQYNVGEKPTVILYTYINRHAEPPNITKHGFDKLLYDLLCGGDTNKFKLPKAGNGNVFFLNKVRFARQEQTKL